MLRGKSRSGRRREELGFFGIRPVLDHRDDEIRFDFIGRNRFVGFRHADQLFFELTTTTEHDDIVNNRLQIFFGQQGEAWH